MYGAGYKLENIKGKTHDLIHDLTHDLIHDLTFSAQTIVCATV